MKVNPHERAEVLAGAIALDEASDDERLEYRRHLSACASCLSALGGEREVERLARLVSQARADEVWEPDIRADVARRIALPSRRWRYGFAVVAAAFIVSVAVHVAGLSRFGRFDFQTPARQVAAARVTLERRPTVVSADSGAARAPRAAQQRRMVVVHHVVQIARTPVSAAAPENARSKAGLAQSNAPAEVAAVIVHRSPNAERSNVPVWRDPRWRTVAMTTTTALSESAPAPPSQSAESLHVSMQLAPAYTTREAAPVGGETAINPQPAMIAYDEGAEGTTVFEVQIDERGVPTKCNVTRSSGYAVLDVAVCQAAMRARYTPKTVSGKPVAGSYTDAFTFRMSETGETLPRRIP